MAEYKLIPIDLIAEPDTPMRAAIADTYIEELGGSIRAMGLLHPLVVFPWQGGYQVAAGHCRLLACRYAGLTEIPCMVYPERTLAVEAAKLHENIFRKDVNPAEEALWFEELIKKYDLTEDALCKLVRQRPDYIGTRLDLVRGYKDVFEALLKGEIKSIGVAKALNQITADAARKMYLESAKDGVSARVAQIWVAEWKRMSLPMPAGAATPTPEGGTPAAPETQMICICCGGRSDPHNLRLVYVHFWELDGFKRVVESYREAADAK